MKFVQIAVSGTEDSADVVYALGSDGTVYSCVNRHDQQRRWQALTPDDATGFDDEGE
jgi:hypothetical protein